MKQSQITFRIKSLLAIVGVFLLYSIFLSPLYYFYPDQSLYIAAGTVGLVVLNVFHTSISLALQNRKIDFANDRELSQFLKEEVEVVADKMDMKTPSVNVKPDYTMNASAMGLTHTTSQVQITSELIANSSREELRSTLAHELAHIKNRDILIMYILYSPYRLVLAVDNWIIDIHNRESSDVIGVLTGVIHYILYFFSMIILALIRLVSRQREYLADLTGAEVTNPETEIRKLRKIEKFNSQIQSLDRTDSREIMQQFSVDKDKMFSTHPPTSKRVENIKETFFDD